MYRNKIINLIFGVATFAILAACGGDAEPRYEPRVEKPEKAHRLRYVQYRKDFNDMNDTHLSAALKIGIEPLASREDVADATRELVCLLDDKAYKLDKLTHSLPLLVPEAAALLKEIGESFQDSLVMHHFSPYKIVVSSVLRTDADVKNLSKRNVNASKRSVHCYGTTFDITYKRFHRVDEELPEVSQAKLKAVLGEVLYDLKRQGRCYVKHEVKQACFHITTRK